MGQTESLEEADDMDLDNTTLINGKRVGYIAKYDSIDDIPAYKLNQPSDLVLDPLGKPMNMTPAFSEETGKRLDKWLDSEKGQATMNKYREEAKQRSIERDERRRARAEETAGE